MIVASLLVRCTPTSAPRATTAPTTAAPAAGAATRRLSVLSRARDRDGDGILDHCDKCPDAPEDYDGTDDDDGCPEPLTVHSSWHPFLRYVYFKEGSAAIQSHQRTVIGWAAATLGAGDSYAIACVGTIAPNEKGGLALASARARAVCDAIAKRGIKRERLETYATASGVFTRGGAVPKQRDWARRVLLMTVKRKPTTWYQKPWRTMKFENGVLVGTNDKPASRPTGPPTCPPSKR
ncbi:MAG: hypothetical protein KC503_16920 [Myxococcales bacterium]|nr:hypothetical protein [Myxococcales bacterium]